jgi:hypothetical protein
LCPLFVPSATKIFGTGIINRASRDKSNCVRPMINHSCTDPVLSYKNGKSLTHLCIVGNAALNSC